MEITVRIALSPEAERLAARLIDVLGDVRNVLSRGAWNALARDERNTGPGLLPGDARSAEDAEAPQPAGEVTDAPAARFATASGRAAAPADPPTTTYGGRGHKKWSEERDAELTRCYRAGWSRAQMLAAVNALPGPPIASIYGIGVRVSELGLSAAALPGPHGPRAPLPAAPQARVMAPVELPPAPARARQEEASVLRSTARPAVVLDGRTPRRAAATRPEPAPFRPVAPAIAERDGAPSMAALQMRDAEASDSAALIALADAIEWGRRNGCKPEPGETALATVRRVNALRQRLGLPCYTLVAARGPQEKLPPTNAELRL